MGLFWGAISVFVIVLLTSGPWGLNDESIAFIIIGALVCCLFSACFDRFAVALNAFLVSAIFVFILMALFLAINELAVVLIIAVIIAFIISAICYRFHDYSFIIISAVSGAFLASLGVYGLIEEYSIEILIRNLFWYGLESPVLIGTVVLGIIGILVQRRRTGRVQADETKQVLNVDQDKENNSSQMKRSYETYKSTVCAKCGTEGEFGAAFCVPCGSKLGGSQYTGQDHGYNINKADVNTGFEVPKSPIFCIKCGTKGEGSAGFCIKCGAKLENASSNDIRSDNQNQASDTQQAHNGDYIATLKATIQGVSGWSKEHKITLVCWSVMLLLSFAQFSFTYGFYFYLSLTMSIICPIALLVGMFISIQKSRMDFMIFPLAFYPLYLLLEMFTFTAGYAINWLSLIYIAMTIYVSYLFYKSQKTKSMKDINGIKKASIIFAVVWGFVVLVGQPLYYQTVFGYSTDASYGFGMLFSSWTIKDTAFFIGTAFLGYQRQK